MKQMFLVALAALTFASQAHAVGRSDGNSKPDSIRKQELKKVRKDAANAANDPARQVEVVSNAASRLGTLNGDQKVALNDLVKDNADVRRMALETVSLMNGETKDFAEMRLEGLSNLKGVKEFTLTDAALTAMGVDKTAHAEQSYVTLMTSTADKAKAWPKEIRDVMTRLGQLANEGIRSGKSRGQAMEDARVAVEKEINAKQKQGEPAFTLKLEDINKFCKG